MEISNFWKKQEKNIVVHGSKMNLVESCVDRHVKTNKNKVAFYFQNNKIIKKYTYEELEKEVNKFANFFKNKKIKENSKIAIFLPKCPELYFSFLAAIKSGNIAVPLFEAFQQEGLELRLKKGDIDVLITNKELKKRLKDKKNFRKLKVVIIDSNDFKKQLKKQSIEFGAVLKNKKDTAMMLFTSSTAGTPVAGIMISHYALVQQHYTAKLVLKLSENSKYWCTAHPGWVTGTVYGIIAPLSIGSTIYILEDHFDSKKWISFLIKNKISVLYTAPTVFRLFKKDIKKSDLKYLENVCSVGEALTIATHDFYKKKGIKIKDTYWQTETGAIVIANLKSKKRALGKSIPGITAEIKKGTIALKPNFPSLMTGIYKHNKMYNSYFNNKWFLTNDLAEKKGDYFYFISRKDDIIKTRGERISPIEVENSLMHHRAVKEAAVIGIPHKTHGNILKAFIILNKEFNESEKLKKEIISFVKENYAGHSYPKEIEFIKNFQKQILEKL